MGGHAVEGGSPTPAAAVSAGKTDFAGRTAAGTQDHRHQNRLVQRQTRQENAQFTIPAPHNARGHPPWVVSAVSPRAKGYMKGLMRSASFTSSKQDEDAAVVKTKKAANLLISQIKASTPATGRAEEGTCSYFPTRRHRRHVSSRSDRSQSFQSHHLPERPSPCDESVTRAFSLQGLPHERIPQLFTDAKILIARRLGSNARNF